MIIVCLCIWIARWRCFVINLKNGFNFNPFYDVISSIIHLYICIYAAAVHINVPIMYTVQRCDLFLFNFFFTRVLWATLFLHCVFVELWGNFLIDLAVQTCGVWLKVRTIWLLCSISYLIKKIVSSLLFFLRFGFTGNWHLEQLGSWG